MYLSLRDRPARTEAASPEEARAVRAAKRGRVSSVVITLGVVSLLTDISSESVAAVLPLYLTTALGLSTLAYGFVDGLMQGASALVRIAGGWAADKGDHPKWVAVVGYGLSAITRGVLLVASSFGAVVAIVAVDRIGKGIRTAPRDAMITASSDPRTLGRSFGVHRTLDTVGAALGPLLAFVVLWADPRRLPDGVRHLVRLRRHRARRARPAGTRPAPAPGRVAHAAPLARGPQAAQVQGLQLRHPRARAAGRPFSWTFLTEPGLRRIFVDGRRPRPAHRRRRLHLPVPAVARRLRDPVVPAPVRRDERRLHVPRDPRGPAGGPGRAGRGSSSGATPRSWSPTCAPASRPGPP